MIIYKVRALFPIWILFGISCVAIEENTKMQDSFHRAVCFQDENMNVACEEFLPVKDNYTEKSVWPPGPYALPMSVYGCPEGRYRGWSEGYLLLTFKDNIVAYISKMEEECTEYSFDWPEVNRFVFQPITSYSVEMHFCFRARQNVSRSFGSFPRGNYSIYADESGCTEGFNLVEQNLTFPKIEYWTSDGHLPNFSIHKYENYAVLSLSLCTMSAYQSDAANITEVSLIFDTPFIFIQNIDNACPVLGENGHYLEEESIYSHPITGGNDTTSRLVQSYCFNYPKTWKNANANELYENLMKTGYILSQMQVTNGNTSVQPQDEKAAMTLSARALQLQRGLQEAGQLYIPWKIFDLGRTYEVSAVIMNRFIDTVATPVPHSFISNEKWSVLYSRALRIAFVLKYQETVKTISILFHRPMAGRYVTLVGNPDDAFLPNLTVDIVIQRIIYDNGDGCNIDIGMTDGAIQNFQISSSSKDLASQWKVRPYHPGWCAEEDASNPFITIDFLNLTRVEGMTIWNWQLTNRVQDNTAFEVSYRFGVKEFNISYAVSLEKFIQYGETFRLEKYRENDEQISFRFLNSPIARYLRINIVQPFTVGLKCLKFELHGCPGFNLFPTLYKSSAKDVIVTKVKDFFEEGFISNPGFPEYYKSGQDLRWIIRSNSDTFISLIFTHISLLKDQRSMEMISCLDRVLLSKRIVQGKKIHRTIDYRLNNEVFMVETSISLVVLSFIACVPTEKKDTTDTGFQVIVRHESSPSCFELDSSLSWENGRQEECFMKSMNIKSMSYLGLPFVGTVEKWTIKSIRKRIKIFVKDFRVPCIRDGVGSEFKMVESAYERTYCNLNRPPEVIHSQSDTFIVTFRKNDDMQDTKYTVGFWIAFYIEEVSLEHLIDFQATTSKLTNVAVHKPAVISSVDKFSLFKPENGNDGDIWYFSTLPTIDPWWMVDLEGIYRVKFMVLILRLQSETEQSEETQRDIEIYTGSDEGSLVITFYHCGTDKESETIPLHHIHTRYIKLQQKVPRNKALRLNEVEVYGELDNNIDEELRNFHIKRTKEKIDWYEKLAYFDWRPVYKKCDKPELENRDYSSWTKWTECSTKCGIGTRERRRHCILNETKYCFGEDTHFEKCVGNGSCPVCINKFKKCYSFFAELTSWQLAGYECWRRYMTLVSINSLEELQFIKYKLRENRHIDINSKIADTSDKFNASYYVHIGLRRTNGTHSSNKFLWEDRSQVRFNAWKPGEPTSGSCVRMNYRYYEPNNTWEAEDCMQGLADFFVCERPATNNEYVSENTEATRFPRYDSNWVEIHERVRTGEYKGTQNITKDVNKCAPWAAYANPHSPVFPKDITGDQNYCRNPNHAFRLWCYIESESIEPEYEQCLVQMPEKDQPSFSVLQYTGTWSRTYKGRQCKRWDEDHFYFDTDFHGENLEMVSNYCRDPFNYGYLWCLTSDSKHPWEPCLISDSSPKRCYETIQKYTVFENLTFSGKECQRWSTHYLFLTRNNKELKLTNEDISEAGIYCRDPFDDGYLWCYTGETEWEPCNASDINSVDNMSFNLTSDTRAFFQCDNGNLIPLRYKCDGKFDCEDLSDETLCWQNYTSHTLLQRENLTSELPGHLEQSSFFQCGSMEWVSIVMKCDNVKDCADASDETGCFTDGQSECAHDEFRCTDGDCIHVSQVCNHVVDCVDHVDEYCDFGTCQSNEYQCDNGECLTVDKRCDGFVHCLDDSDEANCEKCKLTTSFHCDVVKCIDKRLICDTYADCDDGSDEKNCYNRGFSSCQDVWRAGYRQTGIFTIYGLDVKCDFDSVLSQGKMYLYIRNGDIFWTAIHPNYPELSARGYRYVRKGHEIEDSTLESIYRIRRDSCTVATEQTCNPVLNSIMEYDEQFYKETFGFCSCETHAIRCLSGWCDRDWCTESNHTSEISKEVNSQHISQIATFVDGYTHYYDILPKPVKCSYNFQAEENELVCKNDVKVIPNRLRCVYDVDSRGIIAGCRSLSHLKNCGLYNIINEGQINYTQTYTFAEKTHVYWSELFECPGNTLKCPGSYCIPLRFICDGEIQCPGGQDEEDCGCMKEENEVVILVHKHFLSDNFATLQGFVKQLNSDKNIIRLLSYEVSTPLLDFGIESKLLKISDQQIPSFSTVNRFDTCHYSIMAERFLTTLKYTNIKSRGFIFFDTDDDAAAIAESLFSRVKDFDSGFHLFRIVEQPNLKAKVKTKFHHVTNIPVPRWNVLTKTGSSFFPELCRVVSKTYCSNGYKCSSSKTCISLDQICDGQRQCPHGDDELLCEFTCPGNCSCVGFAIDCKHNAIDMALVETLPIQTRHFDISMNRNLSIILEQPYLKMKQLVRLNVSYCKVRDILGAAFFNINNLKVLDVSYNLFTVLRRNVFNVLVHLIELYLHGSYELVTIEAGAFDGLVNMRGLQLVGSQLRKIEAYTFSGLTLEYIDFSNNSINDIDDFAFDDLSVDKINFERNDVKHLNRKIFAGVRNLKELKTSAYKFCCIRPTYLLESDCYPQKDEFSSCEDLMRLSALQTMLWLVGISALIGNFFSVVYRLVYDRERLKLGYGIFVTNLAVADVLMGIYLMIIATADAVYRKRYIYMDEYWRGSGWCTFAGVLSTVSSEASVLFLCLITLDRLFVIKFPFGQIRFNSVRAHLCSIVAWIMSVFIGLLPVFYESYFQNKFYSKSGVCIALPLTRDRPPGWVYSVIVFVGLNFVTFVLVAFGQISIFMEVRKASSRMRKMQSARRKDLTVARNLLLVVTTDFMCWFPIGVMGMMALSGHELSSDAYAWSAVFILPINSALNPILYTVSAILGKTKFNPSTDEQARTELSLELGKYIQEYQSINRQLSWCVNPRKKNISIAEVLENDVGVFASVTLQTAHELFRCLHVLHKGFLVVGKIDKDTVCIRTRKGKLIGSVLIKTNPVSTNKSEDLRNDIFQTGKVINALIQKCNKQAPNI